VLHTRAIVARRGTGNISSSRTLTALGIQAYRQHDTAPLGHANAQHLEHYWSELPPFPHELEICGVTTTCAHKWDPDKLQFPLDTNSHIYSRDLDGTTMLLFAFSLLSLVYIY